jgi:hypothetical protein
MGNSPRARRHGLRRGSPFLAVVITATLVGCGNSGVKTSSTQSTTVASSSIPSTSIATTPTTTLSPTAPPPGGLGVYKRPAPSNIPGGTSTLTLYADGHYTLDASAGVTGRWAYADGRTTFTETSDTACKGILGTYAWSWDGTHLSLTVVSDSCPIREQDFPAGPYTKEA